MCVCVCVCCIYLTLHPLRGLDGRLCVFMLGFLRLGSLFPSLLPFAPDTLGWGVGGAHVTDHISPYGGEGASRVPEERCKGGGAVHKISLQFKAGQPGLARSPNDPQEDGGGEV